MLSRRYETALYCSRPASRLASSGAPAQVLPSEPVTMAGGRVVLGGDVAVSVAPDDPGFFNYSDYEHNTLREMRLGRDRVGARHRIACRSSARSAARTSRTLWPFALYARITSSARPAARRADRPHSADVRRVHAAGLQP